MSFDEAMMSEAGETILSAHNLGAQIVKLKQDEQLTLAQISERLGLEYNRVRRLYKQALEDYINPDVDLLKAEEAVKLDLIESVLRDPVRNGNLNAIDRFLKAQERRSKLFGLDARPGEDANKSTAPKVLDVNVWRAAGTGTGDTGEAAGEDGGTLHVGDQPSSPPDTGVH